MDIEQISVKIRPRTAWEAIDLGFVMAREWYGPLWLLWLATALPLFILSHLVLRDSLIWAGLVIWWFKPLYERPLLLYLSHALFNDAQLNPGRFVRAAVDQPMTLIATLSWRRFDVQRAFILPVTLLERAHGQVLRKRLAVLQRHQQAPLWNTIICFHFEAVITIASFILIVMMLPEKISWLDSIHWLRENETLLLWLNNMLYFVAMSVIAPFYVAAGFALYLTRRSTLEGWDIELGFKQLRNRLEQRNRGAIIASLLAALLVGAVIDQPAFATIDPTPEQARTVIDQVLADEAFGKTETIHSWRYIEQDDDEESSFDWQSWLSDFFNWLFNDFGKMLDSTASVARLLLLAAAGWLIWLIVRRLQQGKRRRHHKHRSHQSSKAPQVELFGLDLSPESLPADVTASCLQLWYANQHREALSLLYRATLSALTHQRLIEIPASATEQECTQIVARHRPVDEADFFDQLMRSWQRLAYGNHHPDLQRVEALCQQWRSLYEIEQ